jgi:hypothetical protein
MIESTDYRYLIRCIKECFHLPGRVREDQFGNADPTPTPPPAREMIHLPFTLNVVFPL